MLNKDASSFYFCGSKLPKSILSFLIVLNQLLLLGTSTFHFPLALRSSL